MRYPEPYRRSNSPYFQFIYTDPITGRRRRKSTGKDTKREAREYIQAFIRQAQRAGARVRFAEYSAPYFVWGRCPHAGRLHDEGKSIGRKHCEEQRYHLERWVFTDPKLPRIPMGEVTRGDLIGLRDRIKSRVKKEAKRIRGDGYNTINQTMKAVKTIFSEAYFRGDIEQDPGHKLGRLKYDEEERSPFALEEVRKLFDLEPGVWRDAQGYLVFRTVAWTGMRCSEVLALEWEQLDLENGLLIIDRAWKHRGDSAAGLPKWEKTRDIALAPSLCGRLAEWRKTAARTDPDDLVFAHGNGKRLGETWWRTRFQNALTAAGIGRAGRWLTPHSFRHTLNTLLLEAGLSDHLVRAYLGWSDDAQNITKVQAGYTHISAESTRTVAESIDSLLQGTNKEPTAADTFAAARARLRIAK